MVHVGGWVGIGLWYFWALRRLWPQSQKRDSVCGSERASFWLAEKSSVKTHMDSGLKLNWKLGPIKCKWQFKNQCGLCGNPPTTSARPIPRLQVVNKPNTVDYQADQCCCQAKPHWSCSKPQTASVTMRNQGTEEGWRTDWDKVETEETKMMRKMGRCERKKGWKSSAAICPRQAATGTNTCSHTHTHTRAEITGVECVWCVCECVSVCVLGEAHSMAGPRDSGAETHH